MRNNVNGGNLALRLLLQQQLLLQFEERAQKREEPEQIVRGVSWLSEPKADPRYAAPKANEWTCPRCRSHQCIRTNPGDQQDATFCCAVCGYTFHGASASRLPAAVRRSDWHRSVRLNRGPHLDSNSGGVRGAQTTTLPISVACVRAPHGFRFIWSPRGSAVTLSSARVAWTPSGKPQPTQ